MRKTITINGKDYIAKASAYTQFKYKNDTGRRMISDLQQMAKIVDMDEEQQLENLDDLIEMTLKMAYIMIEEADASQLTTYEEFLKSIDGMFDNQNWITDVIELATSPISRGNKNNPQS